MKTPALKLVSVGVLLAGCVSAALAQSSNPYADGSPVAPDEWLLVKKGNPWWYTTKPSPTPVALRQRTPTAAEQQVIDRARQLVANRPACRRQFKIDHLCQLNFDQGSKAGCLAPGCG